VGKQFYLDVRTPQGIDRDDVGFESADLETAYLRVIGAINEVASMLTVGDGHGEGYALLITDAEHRILFELWGDDLADAIQYRVYRDAHLTI